MNGKFAIRHYIGDAVICAILALLLTVGCFAFSASDDSNKKVRILKDGKELAVYNLSDNASYDIDGVHIRIYDGKATISESDCADKVCMDMPGVGKNGGGSVCIPNRIVLEPVTDTVSSDAVAG